jgi:chorismate mutase
MSTSTSPLADLRRRIDDLDDRLHDLLMQRAELVEEIAGSKRNSNVPPFRPGREAEILRRLVARHRGRFRRPVLVRLWRELLSGTVAMQADFVVAVYAPDGGSGHWDLARDHYGSHTPMMAYRSMGEVVRAVTEGRAMIGVLPVPDEGEGDAWWRLLAGSGAGAPRVVARLPFAGRGNAREGSDAFAIGRGEPEPTGADLSLLLIETHGGVSRTRLIGALSAVGLAVSLYAAIEPSPEVAWNLVEVDDMLAPDAPRLAEALAPLGDKVGRVASLGAYARPLTAAELSGEGGG